MPKSFLFFILCILGISGIGCEQATIPNPERDKFIQLGLDMADASFPGLSMVSAQVDHASAELVPYWAMEQRMGGGAVGVDPNKAVWIVTLNGKFSYHGSRAGRGHILVSPQRVFVFDAVTGNLHRTQLAARAP